MKSVVLLLLVCMLGANAQIQNIVELAKSLGANTLVRNLEIAGLNGTLATGGGNSYTVFGPTDAAFAALPADVKAKLANVTFLADVLKYHVSAGTRYSSVLYNEQTLASLNGKNLRVNVYTPASGTVVTASGSVVALADQNATNGVIHVVNKVILPPTGNVVDVVSSTSMFSTLLTAVSTAELVSFLQAGPYTVFAPTNAAFSLVTNLNDILKDKAMLTKILQYHVVSGTVYSAGLSNGAKVNTYADQMLTVAISGAGAVSINNAAVTAADLTVTNGVIHTIDKVLIPDLTNGATPIVASISVLFAMLLAYLI